MKVDKNIEINEKVILEFNSNDWKWIDVIEYGYYNGKEYIKYIDGHTYIRYCYRNEHTQQIILSGDFFKLSFAAENYKYDKRLLTELNYPIKKIKSFLTKKYNDPKVVIKQTLK